MSRPIENPDKPNEAFLAWKQRILLEAQKKAATEQPTHQPEQPIKG
jgi:hypothetical protein